MEGILTTAQRQRVGREVALHAPATATARDLVDATAHVINRLESLAASAAVWEMWKAGGIEVSWDGSHQEVAVHATEPDEDDESAVAEHISYPAPVE